MEDNNTNNINQSQPVGPKMPVSPLESQTPVSPMEPQTPVQQADKPSNKTGVIVLASVLIVAIAAVVIVLILTMGNGGDNGGSGSDNGNNSGNSSNVDNGGSSNSSNSSSDSNDSNSNNNSSNSNNNSSSDNANSNNNSGSSDNGQGVQDATDQTDASQIKERDIERANDAVRLNTLLVQYQTNNRANLPEGPSYWKGSLEVVCETGDAACEFAKDYMNGQFSGDSEFVDPDGTPYSLYITENWVDNGSVTLSFGNSNSSLVVDGDGYTIGGVSPFAEHVMYVVPGGECNSENRGVVKSDSKRHFGVMYMLEEGLVYCMD